ncbi:MAG: ankyrin repeat domain-containing protein, partial [bacterium]
MRKIVNENINKYLYGPSDEEIEKRLEKTYMNPNKLLRKSVVAGYLKGVKKALKQGADINTFDDFPLRWSAEDGHLDVVKYLIEQGADIHADDDYALRWAANGGHLDVVKYLAEQGADIHAEDEYALRWAA